MSMRLRSYRHNIQLPPELVDHIIDCLHDCPSDLRSCARVCRAWVAPSRFHLFYRVVIRPRHLREEIVFPRCRNLYHFLQRSPGIALCIRDFQFSVGCEGWVMMLDSEWPKLRTVLPHLLGMLTELRRLSLEGIHWTLLPPDIRASFRTVFALPSLVHIEASSLSFSKLKHFTALLHSPLKYLTVFADWNETYDEEPTRVVNEEESAIQLNHKPCRLEYLRSNMAYESPEFINWLLGPQTVIDISTIRTLDAWCNPKCAENCMARLMTTLCSSLENLTIHHPQVEEWDGSPGDTIDVGCNTNLQRLTLVVGAHVKLPPYLECFLSRLEAPNIQRIVVQFVSTNFDEENGRGWNEIDRILAGIKFGKLKNLGIELRHCRTRDMDANFMIATFLPLAEWALHCGEVCGEIVQ